MRNMKKPLKDLVQNNGLEVSLDQELTESLDRPLFQADNRDISGSRDGLKIESSDSNLKKNLQNSNKGKDGLRFDPEGFLHDPYDNFTTDQQDGFQGNIFTQQMDEMGNKNTAMQGLSFDEIKEKLNQGFDAKEAKAKKEKMFVTIDDHSSMNQTMASTNLMNSTFCPEFNLKKKLENECGTFKYLQKDFQSFLRTSLMANKENYRGNSSEKPDFEKPDFDLNNEQYNYGAIGEQDNQFEAFIQAEPIEDKFIGDEKVDELNYDEGSTTTSSHIDNLLKAIKKRKGKEGSFAKVVEDLGQTRDAADLFYDLMCLTKLGEVSLKQDFQNTMDGNTRLPKIGITVVN